MKEKLKYYWEELLWNIDYYWKEIKSPFLEIKWFIQRGKRGYSDKDLWSLDYYLCEWMPEAIRSYKNSLSWPGSHVDGTQMTYKQYQKILEKMAVGFESAKAISNMEYFKGNKICKRTYNQLNKKEKEGLILFSDYFTSLWD